MLPRLVLAALLAVLAAPAPASAAFRAPCVPGDASSPTCTWWDARVTFVADGDTVDADIEGAGVRRVRVTGINAMELTRYSHDPARRAGACHGPEATAAAERAVAAGGRRVRLAAQRDGSRSGDRLRRSVWVRDGDGWRDLARAQLEAGHALWLPNPVEDAHNREYARLAQKAAAARRGLYEPAACGAGPAQDVPVTVVANWDADGSDEENLPGEWVDVRNAGSRPLSLAGWWVRDSDLRLEGDVPGHRLPASATVPPGGTLRLRVGCGADGAAELHWCQDDSVFDNTGDGAYLFDPDGDLRASFIYPCRVGCRNPLRSRVRISVRPRTPESIAIRNTGRTPVDLGDHVLKLRNHRKAGSYVFGYPFRPGAVLRPGATMRVRPGGSAARDRGLVRHVGRRGPALADGGGAVELRTAGDIRVACRAWGDATCRPRPVR